MLNFSISTAIHRIFEKDEFNSLSKCTKTWSQNKTHSAPKDNKKFHARMQRLVASAGKFSFQYSANFTARSTYCRFPLKTWAVSNYSSDKQVTCELNLYLVRDCLPHPPTPTNSALPRCWRIMRAMRDMCSMASMKKTSFISRCDAIL